MLRYQDHMLDSPPPGTAEGLYKKLFAIVQGIVFVNPSMSSKELKELDRRFAQLLTAPRGVIAEC